MTTLRTGMGVRRARQPGLGRHCVHCPRNAQEPDGPAAECRWRTCCRGSFKSLAWCDSPSAFPAFPYPVPSRRGPLDTDHGGHRPGAPTRLWDGVGSGYDGILPTGCDRSRKERHRPIIDSSFLQAVSPRSVVERTLVTRTKPQPHCFKNPEEAAPNPDAYLRAAGDGVT
jgi:hypothetical protein